jgi:hypothetical protein
MVARSSHLLKGSSHNIGAGKLADLSDAHELAAPDGTRTAMGDTWCRMAEEAGRVEKELAAMIPRRAKPGQ